MRKRLTLMFAAAMCAATVSASPVTRSEAVAYANAYLSNILEAGNKAVSAAPIMFGANAPIYAVSLAPQGWMLIAADDVIAPIIGYSLTGGLEADDINDNMYAYLGHYASDVEAATARGDEKNPSWATDTIASTNKAASAVEPLIDVEWNQSGKYRQSCPSSASKGDAIVGCVAVGLGQAMSHYKSPKRPTGYMSYNSENYGTLSIDYDAEDAYDWSAIINAQNESSDGKECARFLYHCGVAVQMNYGPDGSGVSYMGNVPYALKTFFGYSNKVTNVKKSSYTQDEWIALLKSELSAGHPIIYAGYSTSGGHCFNIDGYDKSGLFHFNFGWGGSKNGYMNISSHEYNSGELCTLNFAPATGAPLSIAVSNSSISKGTAAGTVVATLSTETDKEGCEFTYSVSGVENVLTHVIPDPVFDVDGDKLITNSLFATKYPASSAARSVSVNITSTNATTGASTTVKTSFTLKAASTALTAIETAGIRISQTSGAVTITAGGEKILATVSSVSGVALGVQEIEPNASYSFKGLAPGFYILSIAGSDISESTRVLIK